MARKGSGKPLEPIKPLSPEEEARYKAKANAARSPYYKALKMKPWERQAMSEEEFGYLLAFVAANPRLVQKLIINAALVLEERAKESEANT